MTALALGLGRDAKPYIVLGIFLSYAALLMALRPLLDLKAVRDFVIPIAFYLLGRRWGDPRMADRVALLGGLIVLIFGVFEATALDTYVDFFNIAKYYVARDSAATGGSGADRLRPADIGTLHQWLPMGRPDHSAVPGAAPFFFGFSRTRLDGQFRRHPLSLVALPERHDGPLADDGDRPRCHRSGRRALRPLRLYSWTAAFAAAPRILPPWWFSLPFVIMSGFAIYGFTSRRWIGRTTLPAGCCGRHGSSQSLSDGAVWGLSVEKPFLADSGYAYSLNQIGLVGGVRALGLVHLHAAPERGRMALQVLCRHLYLPVAGDQRLGLLDQDGRPALVHAGVQRWFRSTGGDVPPAPIMNGVPSFGRPDPRHPARRSPLAPRDGDRALSRRHTRRGDPRLTRRPGPRTGRVARRPRRCGTPGRVAGRSSAACRR